MLKASVSNLGKGKTQRLQLIHRVERFQRTVRHSVAHQHHIFSSVPKEGFAPQNTAKPRSVPAYFYPTRPFRPTSRSPPPLPLHVTRQLLLNLDGKPTARSKQQNVTNTNSARKLNWSHRRLLGLGSVIPSV